MATADVVSLLYAMTYGMIAYALPAYFTFKSLEHKGDVDVRNWAIYWTVLALFACGHTLLDCTLCWLPGYYFLKLGFMAALWHPSTQLAVWLYERSVGPLLGTYEADIDNLWRDAWTRGSDVAQQQALSARASLQRISGKASVMLSQAVNKQQSKLQQQQQRMSGSGVGVGAGGAASYAGSNTGIGGMSDSTGMRGMGGSTGAGGMSGMPAAQMGRSTGLGNTHATPMSGMSGVTAGAPGYGLHTE